MSSEKTEQPTAKRQEDARKKGQIARTKEAGQAASLIATVAALGWMGDFFIGRLIEILKQGLTRVGDSPVAPIDPGEITRIAVEGIASVGIIVGPIAGAAIVTACALHTAQGGWNFASEALHFKWERLNPATGFKRFGLSKGGVELLRTTIAVTVITVLAWQIVWPFIEASGEIARLSPADGASRMWAEAVRLIKQAALGLLVLAAADYFVQRYQLMNSLKMTKQEVQDESKMTQGNPEIKARVRRVQREMVRRRMLSATKTATLVITNPTHYAVALEYRRSSMLAPIVVAKGQDLMAQRMKAVAREHGVPTVENVALARALYASAEVGDVIPGPLFEAVAEVLAYLIRLKQLSL